MEKIFKTSPFSEVRISAAFSSLSQTPPLHSASRSAGSSKAMGTAPGGTSGPPPSGGSGCTGSGSVSGSVGSTGAGSAGSGVTGTGSSPEGSAGSETGSEYSFAPSEGVSAGAVFPAQADSVSKSASKRLKMAR